MYTPLRILLIIFLIFHLYPIHSQSTEPKGCDAYPNPHPSPQKVPADRSMSGYVYMESHKCIDFIGSPSKCSGTIESLNGKYSVKFKASYMIGIVRVSVSTGYVDLFLKEDSSHHLKVRVTPQQPCALRGSFFGSKKGSAFYLDSGNYSAGGIRWETISAY